MAHIRIRVAAYASFAALVAVMFLLSVHTLSSIYQDIGRHITLGRIIWTTHHIPATNLFSYTARDFPFINHHWLGEVALYLGDRLFGLKGLILIKALFVALAYGLALGAAWRPRLALPALAVGLVSALIMVERTDVRPEIVSFVFLAWFLFVLYRSGLQATSYKLLWTLPLVQLFWVNTHIYFFMGPFTWLAFLVGKVVASEDKKSALQSLLTLDFGLVTLLIFLATLANPHGLAGALYPLHIFGNYGYSVVENKSPFFLRAFGYPQMTSIALYLGIALAAASFLVNRRRLRQNVFGLILASATAILALTMVRNFPLFALVMLPVVLKNIDEGLGPSGAERLGRSRTLTGWGMVLLALFGVSVVTDQIYDQAGMAGRRFGLQVPAGPQQPVDFFRAAGLKGPLFNNFDIGSFLIWKLPEEPVFIDGRPEAYPADFIQNTYIRMQEDPAVWQRASAQYGINTILWDYYDITPWSRAFLTRLSSDPQWVPVYRDHGILILVKKIPANAAIIAKYRLH